MHVACWRASRRVTSIQQTTDASVTRRERIRNRSLERRKHVGYDGAVGRCWCANRLVQPSCQLGHKLVRVVERVVIDDYNRAAVSRGAKTGEDGLHVGRCRGKYLRGAVRYARRIAIALLLQQKQVVGAEIDGHQPRVAVMLQETCGESQLRGLGRAVNNVQGKVRAIRAASVIGPGR